MSAVVTIWYEGKDEGSRQRPFQIITEGRYGQVKLLELTDNARFIYRLTLLMQDDPKELFRDLHSHDLVSVLRLQVDGDVIFQSKRWRKSMFRKNK